MTLNINHITNTITQSSGNIVFGSANTITFSSSGALGANGAYGSTGQVLSSAGPGAPPTWTTVGGGASLSSISASTTYYVGLSSNTSGSWTDARLDTGNLYYTSADNTLYATNFNTASDLTLKDNVHKIDNALDILNQLRGVSFNWKSNGNKSYGLIAQELETVLPELVNTVDGVKSISYIALIGFLLEAIKDLNNKLENR